MAKKKRRAANDRAFKAYKSEGRFAKNKIAKLQKRYDMYGEEHIFRLLEEAKEVPPKYSRKPPKIRGLNSKSKMYDNTYGTVMRALQSPGTCGLTAGEQLSKLLGIEMPKPETKKAKRKPKITVKNSKMRRMEKIASERT